MGGTATMRDAPSSWCGTARSPCARCLERARTSAAVKRSGRDAWHTGVVLLLIGRGLALTGYLLPWDQRSYWETVVTINLSQLAPGAGRLAAAALRGGETIGALP